MPIKFHLFINKVKSETLTILLYAAIYQLSWRYHGISNSYLGVIMCQSLVKADPSNGMKVIAISNWSVLRDLSKGCCSRDAEIDPLNSLSFILLNKFYLLEIQADNEACMTVGVEVKA